MAETPRWKCFQVGNDYLASTKHAEDAAILMAAWGNDSYVSWNRRVIVWREGYEPLSAGENYDRAAAIMRERLSNWLAERK